MVLIPWYLYIYTGDTTLLERYYKPIKKYLDHLERNSVNYLLNFGIDDHKAYYTKTGGDIIASGYFYFLTDLFVEMAKILDNQQDVEHYSQLAVNIKKAFQKEYYDGELKLFGNAGQTSLSQGLYMELVPEKDREQLIQNLLAKIDSAEYHFDAGVGGVKSLYESLDETGNNATIYQMVNQTDFPGYGYWIEQGANTLWQDWDGSMSLNHVMFGSVSEWFFQSLAGLNPDSQQPGFKNILLKPNFIDDLEWARADYESVHGKIISGWEKKDDVVEMRIQIPVNTTATMHVPDGYKVIDSFSEETNKKEFNIPSGNYKIKMKKY